MSLQETRKQPATMSVVEAGEVLGIGRSLAYAAAARGEIPVIKIGRLMRVPTAWVERTLQLTFKQ